MTNTNPKHYKKGAIEPWDFIISQKMSFLEGNIIKYITRYKEKDGIEDLEKANVYLQKLIESNNDQDLDYEEFVIDEYGDICEFRAYQEELAKAINKMQEREAILSMEKLQEALDIRSEADEEAEKESKKIDQEVRMLINAYQGKYGDFTDLSNEVSRKSVNTFLQKLRNGEI